MLNIINRYFYYNKKINIIQLGGRVMLISIVGKSGAGKSTITNQLIKLNANILNLDIDKIGHYVNDIPTVQKQLVESLGNSIIKNNQIDRKVLGKIVFNNKAAMQILTEITWPVMEKIIDQYIDENKDNIIVLDWLLLPQTKYFHQSNLKVLVTAPFNIRLKRIRKRDNISTTKFLEREKNTIEFNPTDFDMIVNNIDNVESEVKKIYEKSIISSKL